MKAQPIDLIYLEEYSGGDQAFEQEILTLFVADVQHQISEIQTAYQHQDWPTLRQSAHQLKGASGNIGARTLQHLAAEIEASSLPQSTVPTLLAQLEVAYEAVLAQVQALGYGEF